MNRRETYRHALLQYPSLFDCPLDVSCHLFAVIGNGYEWDNDGELTSVFREEAREPRLKQPPGPELSAYPQLRARYDLEHKAAMLKYEFIKANIEQVLDCPASTAFFRGPGTRNGHYLVDGICWDSVKASAFDFPGSIQPDWAEALLDFLNWWTTNLRQVLGVDRDGKIDFWQQRHKDAYKAIREANERLYPIVHGITAEEYKRRTGEIAKRVVASLSRQGEN